MLQSEKTESAVYRQLLVSAILSMLIMWTGILWTWHIGLQTNQIDHRLFHAQEGLAALQSYVNRSKIHEP